MPPKTPEKSSDPVKPSIIPLSPSSAKKAKDQNPASSATGSTPQPAPQPAADAEPAPPSTPLRLTEANLCQHEGWDNNSPELSPSQHVEKYSPRKEKEKAKDTSTSTNTTPTKEKKTPETKKPNTPVPLTPQVQIIRSGDAAIPPTPFTAERREGVKLRGRGADEIGSVVAEDGSPEVKKGTKKEKEKEKEKMMEREYELEQKQDVEEEKPVESDPVDDGGKRYLGYEVQGKFTPKEERE